METSNSIIGDFLDINRDISMIAASDKMKFINKLRARYYRNKLIKKTEKLSKANIPLSKDNILELVTYIYANYLPSGRFGCINNISYFQASSSYVVSVVMDSCSYTIKITAESKKFTITILANGKRENKGYTVELESMYTNNREIEDYIDILNQALISTMSEYILDTLKSYTGKANEL